MKLHYYILKLWPDRVDLYIGFTSKEVADMVYDQKIEQFNTYKEAKQWVLDIFSDMVSYET